MLRANSRLRHKLGPAEIDLLTHIAGSVERILPHASNYGLALKISSDGDMTVYYKGEEFFRM
jgi:hypothetical protein